MTINKFKQTEVGEIPESWKVSTIGDFCSLMTSGGTPSRDKKEFYEKGTIAWIKTKELNDTYIFATEEKITENAIKNSSAKLLPKNTVSMAMYGATVGKLGILGIESSTNQACCNMVTNDSSDYKFLFYSLLNNRQQLIGQANGAAQQNLSVGVIKNFKVVKPPLDKQRKISSILSSLDDKIELNQKTIKNLEEIGQTLFKRWFIDFEFPNEKGEPYISSGGEMIESELGEIPKGWSLKKLSDISDISIGRTPPRLESKWFSKNEQDIKWISIRDMGNAGTYIYETSEYLTKEAIDKFRVPIIPKNTVILSFKLTVGRVSITTEDMVSNEAIAHIKLTEDKYSPEYAYLLLKKFDFTSLGSTSSIATAVNSASIKNIPVLAPDIYIVDKFSNIVRSVFSEIFVLTKETKNLKSLSNSLLPNLLSGKIRV